ncbi:MAG: AAA family ATPase [Acidimicrobiia bacterium]
MLLLINGEPGVGKSTFGRLHSRVHPLSLVIDIDAIRMQLGRWEEHTESRQIARDLAVALARAIFEHRERRDRAAVHRPLGVR